MGDGKSRMEGPRFEGFGKFIAGCEYLRRPWDRLQQRGPSPDPHPGPPIRWEREERPRPEGVARPEDRCVIWTIAVAARRSRDRGWRSKIEDERKLLRTV